MINSIQFKNLFSIDNSGELSLSKFNFLIGENGSGKTNLLKAIKLTRYLVNGEFLSNVLNQLTMNISNFTYLGKGDDSSISIEFTADDNYHYRFSYAISIDNVRSEERFSLPHEKLEQYKDGSWSTIYVRNHYEVIFLNEDIDVVINPHQLFLATYNHKLLKHAQQELKSIYRIDPSDMQNNIDSVTKLGRHPIDNINALAAHLKIRNPNSFKEAVQYIKKVIPEFQDVDVVNLEELMKRSEKKINMDMKDAYLINWYQNDLDVPLSASTLSYGNRRLIYYIFAIFSLSENTFISFEEIENGSHIGRVAKVIDLLRTLAHNRNIQLVITTHSYEILNHLMPKEIIFCEKSNGGSKYKRLSDTKEYLKLEKVLGEYSSARDYIESGYY